MSEGKMTDDILDAVKLAMNAIFNVMTLCNFGSEKLKLLDGYLYYLGRHANTEEERNAIKEKICSLIGGECDHNELVGISKAVDGITTHGCEIQIWVDYIIDSDFIKNKKPLLEMIYDSLEQEQERILREIKKLETRDIG
ncbi:MAG: hypothetical protein RXR31_02260 [Thermoproteota archaeon]